MIVITFDQSAFKTAKGPKAQAVLTIAGKEVKSSLTITELEYSQRTIQEDADLTAYVAAGYVTVGDLRDRAMEGDMALTISPTTAVPAPVTGVPDDQVVVLTLKDAAGNVHDWFDGTLAGLATGAEVTSGGGEGDPESADLVFVKGIAKVNYQNTTGTWANADTSTLTIADLTILGYTVTGGTFVQTFTT